MTDDQLIEITKQLIAIPSTAENPRALQEALTVIANVVTAACPDVTIEYFKSNNKPSLLAYRAKKRPVNFRMILNGHLDVVPGKPDQYKAVIKDDKLYGRGAYDMKAAVVALTAIFCEFVNEVPYDLGLQVVTDEESNGKYGTLHQIERGVRADFVICGDCGRLPTRYEIANETKGIAIADISFKGSSAHGAYPWRGDNAIMQAMEFAHALHEKYPTPEEETFSTTASISSIGTSNTAHTMVPDDAHLRINARFTNDDPNFHTKEAFTAFIKKLHPNATVTNMRDFCAPAYCDPNNPLLLSLKAAAEKIEGHEFEFVMRHGTGDGRYYANVGNQACEFGIAGEQQHGEDENISIEAFHNYLATMRVFLKKTSEAPNS